MIEAYKVMYPSEVCDNELKLNAWKESERTDQETDNLKLFYKILKLKSLINKSKPK